MKRLLLFAALLCAVTLAIGSSFVSNASKAGPKQRASMTFTEPAGARVPPAVQRTSAASDA